jgi:hypothetical protein
MTTRIIGMKEFRQNMGKFSKEAKKKKMRLIIMSHSMPIWEIHPVLDREKLEDELLFEKFSARIEKGLRDAKAGKTFTAEEVRKRLGI